MKEYGMVNEMIFDFAVRSIIGTREEQQDCVGVTELPDGLLGIVCDGMGGMTKGALASQTAVRCLAELFPMRPDGVSVPDWFLHCVDVMDESVCKIKDEHNDGVNPGTTVVAVYLSGGELYWLSVGDSRLYIIRGDEIVAATRDHNFSLYVEERQNLGTATSEEIASMEKHGEALMSYIGIGGIEMMDLNRNPFALCAGDKLLLTSDGLFRLLDDSEIYGIIEREETVHEAADALIAQAETKAEISGSDNVSFILVKTEEKNETGKMQ